MLQDLVSSIESLFDRNNPKYIKINQELKLRFVKKKLELMINLLTERLGEDELLGIIWPEAGICRAYVNKDGSIYYTESDCEGSWGGWTDLKKYFEEEITSFSEAYSLYHKLLKNTIYEVSKFKNSYGGTLSFKEDRGLTNLAA